MEMRHSGCGALLSPQRRIPDLPALASEQGGSTPKPSFAARETSAARESYRSTMPRGSLDCDKLRLSIRAPRWFALR